MKLLKRQILFMLASEKDFAYHTRFNYQPYNYLYARLKPFKPSSIRDGCLQLVSTGYLDKIRKNNRIYFRLTASGRAKLLSFLPSYRLSGSLKEVVWRLAIINPDCLSRGAKQSAQSAYCALRGQLDRLGYRRISRGAYLSPFAKASQLKEYVLKKGLSRQVILWEANKLLVGDMAVLSHQLWGLGRLYEKYTKFVTQTKQLLKETRNQKTLTHQQKNKYYQLTNDLYFLLVSDPGLPRLAVAYRWPRESAKKLFWQLNKRLETLENDDVN